MEKGKIIETLKSQVEDLMGMIKWQNDLIFDLNNEIEANKKEIEGYKWWEDFYRNKVSELEDKLEEYEPEREGQEK